MDTMIKVLNVLKEPSADTFNDLCDKNSLMDKADFCMQIHCSDCVFSMSKGNLDKTIKISTKLGI
jgi:hypothetical protein